MRKFVFLMITVPLACLATTVDAQIRLPTLEEAQEISQSTGLPILAMAGRET